MSGAGLVLGAFLISFITQSILVRTIGQRIVDLPNHRSSHSVPTPRIGGIGVLLALLLAIPTMGFSIPVVAAWLLGLVGLRDDIRPVSATARLGLQVLLLAAATWAMGANALWGPLLLLLMVGYVNAFNFMDGVNGISGMNAAVVGVNFAIAGLVFGSQGTLSIGLVLTGAVLGFLPMNLLGRVFLGDVGSYAIGALIATTSFWAWEAGVPWPVVIGVLLIYFADTGTTMARRTLRGENLLSAHRGHVYQQVSAGVAGHFAAATTTASFSLLTAIGGWLVLESPIAGFVFWALAVGGYVAAVVPIAHRFGRG